MNNNINLCDKGVESQINEEVAFQPKNNWLILSETITGLSHIQDGIPCQDNHIVKPINSQWGVAVVSDGLSTKSLSDIGSKFVSEKTTDILTKIIEENRWVERNVLPEEKQWRDISHLSLQNVYVSLQDYAAKEKLDITEMGCTVIAVIYSPLGLMIVHIGDGRAGYCDMDGNWQAMMTPFRGEDGGIVHIAHHLVWKEENWPVCIGSKVVKNPCKAFCLMSDGCEYFSYEILIRKNNKLIRMNRPSKAFFEPVLNYIYDLHIKSLPDWKVVLRDEWKKLLTDGTKRIADEPDDKTMILGVMINDILED